MSTSAQIGNIYAKALGIYKSSRWQDKQSIKSASEKGAAYYDVLRYVKSYEDFSYFDKNHLLTFPGVYIFNSDLDYLYVYTWVTFLPKFTKRAFESSQSIKKNKNARIKIISLNVDFMVEWNEHQENLLGKKIKEKDIKK